MKNLNNNIIILILKKIFSLFVKLRYPNVPKEYLYFYRDTYVCKAYQIRYFISDYVFSKKYKTISYHGEFGEELQFTLPFAYWHFKNGTLKKTMSFPNTKELYFFSENHEECFTERSNEGNYNFELPRILFSHDYKLKKWLQVPLKEFYKNNIYIFEKPLLIIANKYNTEWDAPPINFFNIKILEYIFTNLKNKYTIVYNRPKAKYLVNDNSEIQDLNEFEWIKNVHPDVLLMDDLYEKNKVNASNFNHFQLCVYANCENFISVHGGASVLASYFGGKNLIYSKQGAEHYFKCYEKLYPQLSGAKIFHAKNEDEIINYIKLFF